MHSHHESGKRMVFKNYVYIAKLVNGEEVLRSYDGISDSSIKRALRIQYKLNKVTS